MIEINNLTGKPIDQKSLKKIAEKVLKGEKNKDSELSIAFVAETKIKELNKKYRKKNKATDVLAFGQNQKSKIKPVASLPVILSELSKNQKFAKPFLGEIIICLKEVKKNAKRFDSAPEEELARVLIHGILHLLGYEHERGGKKAEKMAKKEKYYFCKLNL